jgi:hypothetical protein
MGSELNIRYWKDGSVLVESDGWDCFLHNEVLNPMINWLNLFHNDIESGKPCSGTDKLNGVMYLSVYGNLTIKTNRDVVFLNKDNRIKFMVWLNDNQKLVNTREVIV